MMTAYLLPPTFPRPSSRPPTCTAAPTTPNRPASTASSIASSNASCTPSLQSRLQSILSTLQTLETLTRPSHTPPRHKARFDSLPPQAKTASQMLGRLTPGCEGTKGVFPRCNFGCTPCYHSSSANKVRTDGVHTVTEVARQMHLLRQERGDVAHCQLIGGEVSLLDAKDHALALETMRFFGRIPMSFTHGDFDYDYLYRLATEEGKRRFDRLDFAVHFDMGMKGRRGIPKPNNEQDLMPYRKRFVDMFVRLKKETGTNFYLAHNMTVQPCNLSQVADTTRQMKHLHFRLLSFQPAALQGDRRVAHTSTILQDDGQAVWNQIENGMGIRLPYTLFQMGDVRCNRMAVCGIINDDNATAFSLFDDKCQQDVHCRDLIFKHIGNIVLKPYILVLKVIRVLFSRPWLLIPFFLWVNRNIKRAGGLWPILRYRVRILTIVMHRFMDADDVQKAWTLMQKQIAHDDPQVQAAGPRIQETMQRLAACSYAMAQPENGQIVPACVQHSVYDPDENERLAQLLPLREKSCDETVAVVEP